MPADHVDVRGAEVGGIPEGHDASDHAAPVAALGDVLRVAESEHQLVAGFGVLGEGEAAFGDGGGEAVVWEGGSDDVEGGSGGRGEEREDFGDFEEGTGPWFYVRCSLFFCFFRLMWVWDSYLHPWQKSSGMAPSTEDFWWTKWMARVPKPSTSIEVR